MKFLNLGKLQNFVHTKYQILMSINLQEVNFFLTKDDGYKNI